MAGAVTDGGSVSGKVTFDGALPEDAVERITISKNPDVCDDEGTGYREVVWVDVKDGALRGAFVFIEKIAKGKEWAVPEGDGYVNPAKGLSLPALGAGGQTGPRRYPTIAIRIRCCTISIPAK